ALWVYGSGFWPARARFNRVLTHKPAACQNRLSRACCLSTSEGDKLLGLLSPIQAKKSIEAYKRLIIMNNIMPPPPPSTPHEIPAQEAGQRVDNWLLKYFRGIPKSHVYRLIRTGQVRINGRRIKPTYRLMAGDRIRIPPFSPSPRTLAREKKPVRHLSADYSILYEDDDFMVLNKPSGLAVHGGTGIVAGLIERIRATQPVGTYLELAHRLDRSTSGCLVFAKHR
ncbi:ribosomal large subunit pseudouridine synthase C, partial [mine drainage metagenome]